LLNLKERRAIRGNLPVFKTNLLFASYDRVAIDTVATRVMGLNPTKVYHVYLCAERGCGNIDLNRIDVLGKKVKDVEMKCYPQLKQKAVMLAR
jgi:uncharacterized protein (DUF362 family)